MRRRTVLFALAVLPVLARGADFDHGHAAWSALLKRHVVVSAGGTASRMRYAALARERGALITYLERLSRVSEAEFHGWTKAQRMAFLINAYNAHMTEKVLTRYPDLKSVWDFGKVLGNPFKDRFFVLFGRPYSLDDIEHETLRKPGAYDEPRIHFAVNCASAGCPMLREEAYVADRLEQQLEDQTVRFLSDRSRNRYDATAGRLEISEIFDWYRADFERGYGGTRSREQFLARYADVLADRPEQRRAIREGRVPIRYAAYDWSLNDAQEDRYGH